MTLLLQSISIIASKSRGIQNRDEAWSVILYAVQNCNLWRMVLENEAAIDFYSKLFFLIFLAVPEIVLFGWPKKNLCRFGIINRSKKMYISLGPR
jgi:hypothetical protein